MTKLFTALLILIVVAGCNTASKASTAYRSLGAVQDISVGEPLAVLSVVGGLCLCAGMVLLVITRGTRGWYPVIGGMVLVVLNYMVAQYSHLIFYPVVVFTGLISAAWTYKTVSQILKEKRSK